MDYYYPEKEIWRPSTTQGFAEKWHEETLALMPEIELIVLVGNAQDYYLKTIRKFNGKQSRQ